MTTKPHFYTKKATRKLTLSLCLVFALSACTTTSNPLTKPTVSIDKINTSHDTDTYAPSDAAIRCQSHARNIAMHAETVASTAQYLAAAKAMNSCISSALQNSAYSNNQAQQEAIMKMMAVATLNFIKAGDVITATRAVNRFKRIYPHQDLYFEDYTSFLDTATALLSTEPLGASQMSSLNISRALRDEIERKHYWLNH